MTLYSFEDRKPSIAKTAFVHDTAVLIGDIDIGEGCFIAAGACLRGDWGRIEVGEGSNIQENVVIHARPGEVTKLAANSHVGHGAIMHGCEWKEHVLVGMGAINNDGVVVGEDSLIASGALLAPNMQVPPRSLVVGVPGRIAREVSEKMLEYTWAGTKLYQTLPERNRNTLREVTHDECTQE
jgi:phenylacetic acid degradation protein